MFCMECIQCNRAFSTFRRKMKHMYTKFNVMYLLEENHNSNSISIANLTAPNLVVAHWQTQKK